MRVLALFIITACWLLGTCSETPPLTEQIKVRGELRVVTRNSPIAYYLGPEGPRGPEYDLVAGFARSIGVELDLIVADSIDSIIPDIAGGHADLAAAGLSVTELRRAEVAFGPVYQDVTEHLIYKLNTGKPKSLADVVGGRIEIIAGSSHAETLEELRHRYPELVWIENPGVEMEELLARLSAGEIDYTLADSNEFNVTRHFHPEVRAALDLGQTRGLAWVFKSGHDRSLVEAAEAYFTKIRESGRLARLKERYYGHAEDFDYVGTRTFLRDIERKLPLFRYWFEEAGQAVDIDWRLLAAMGYQESHWNAQAKSPTGVRGLMMLTRATAGQMGVADRLDPEQSIHGGARYFRRVKAKIPERIPEPDRTWLALAAYNVGFGHMEDARIITQIRGGNPDSWKAVRDNLPLLTQKKWYSRVKYGYARGWEPVTYVENIRTYHSILLWKLPPSEILQASGEADEDDAAVSEAM